MVTAHISIQGGNGFSIGNEKRNGRVAWGEIHKLPKMSCSHSALLTALLTEGLHAGTQFVGKFLPRGNRFGWDHPHDNVGVKSTQLVSGRRSESAFNEVARRCITHLARDEKTKAAVRCFGCQNVANQMRLCQLCTATKRLPNIARPYKAMTPVEHGSL